MSSIMISIIKCRKRAPEGMGLYRKLCRNYSKRRHGRSATSRALDHFDNFYGGLYKHRWNSIRLALLSENKCVALVNNFGDVRETEEFLKCQGAIELKRLIEIYDSDPVFSKTASLRKGFSNKIGDNFEAQIKSEEDYVIRELYPENYHDVHEKKKFYSEKNEEPDGEATEEDSYLKLNKSPTSLLEDLNKSQIDSSRLIDSSSGFDTSTLNEYVPATTLKGLNTYVPETDYYKFYEVDSDHSADIEEEKEINFPKYLRVYSFPRGDITYYPQPVPCRSGPLNYYVLDGTSILAVLALGLLPQDSVLDMCSAPGNKAMAIIQTMLPGNLTLNENRISGINRLTKILDNYVYNAPKDFQDRITITNYDALQMDGENQFDKILVDVPCTYDRYSVTVDTDNIFRSDRVQERLEMPAFQASLLEKALKLVKPGGTVVYSTSTLSPIQNDGVVGVALRNARLSHGMEITVKDLTTALTPMSSFFRFASGIGLKYGFLVVPFLPCNFGPMYCSKLVKKK